MPYLGPTGILRRQIAEDPDKGKLCPESDYKYEGIARELGSSKGVDEKCREKVLREFTLKRHAQRYKEIYGEILKQ